ncbi:MAG TPA: biotin/lipoyl-containing protein, partial [Gemmatimonadota bacterium]|nr:biotin/lipoyl-containing protein [Gemmatimonadota bacterium]
MPVDVIMPQMGESIAEGTLVKWLKKPGDAVERDENLFEISTDKVDAEIPSPSSGTLGEILVHEGQTVEVGTVVATILQSGEVLSSQADGSAQKEPSTPPEAPGAQPQTVPEAEPAAVTVTDGHDGRALASKEQLRRTRSSPLVRNIAREHGVDVSRMEGTGLSGRVTKRDILAYVAEQESAAPEEIEPAAPARETALPSRPAPEPGPAAPPERRQPPAAATAGAGPRPFADGDRVEIEPMSIMRQRIAEHMIASRRTSAHVTSFFEIDMTQVDELRRRNKESFLADSGVKLTFMPFIIKALVAAIKEW